MDQCPYCGSLSLQNVEIIDDEDRVTVIFDECADCFAILGVRIPPVFNPDDDPINYHEGEFE